MANLFKGLEQIEAAREQFTGQSFMAGLFAGKPDFSLLKMPEETPEDKAAWEQFRPHLESFLTTQVDPDEIERTARIPDSVLKGLFALGAFGMKIPQQYGGLGFSYTNYGRALMLMASWSNALALTVAVPQSIGIAMPLLLFGNEEQRCTYLPLVAREAVSAFALTESITGSDAANIATEAILDSAGSMFIVNGEKLWCTNGPLARYITLIARVPAKRSPHNGRTSWVPAPDGKGADDRVHTAFILDMQTPGVHVRQHCHFEGCRGIENGYMTFTDVHIPTYNVIGEVGRGLKYALTILNVGRAVSIPAICVGMAKQAWQPTLDRANQRLTFQKPLGTRQTQRVRLGHMAANLFAMEALAFTAWRMADQHTYDVRIEAAIAKLFCSETTIQFLKDVQIIFGGMGYETADSKRLRGEPAFGIEQLVRDAEMYRIGEGATDILRPFVAREGLNMHLERAGHLFDERTTGVRRVVELQRLLKFYAPWYASQWTAHPVPLGTETQHPRVRPKLLFVERASRRLARTILYVLLLYRGSLRDDQGRQNRIEMVGEDLLVIATTALYAEAQERTAGRSEVWDLTDETFLEAKHRVEHNFRELIHNQDMGVAAIGGRALSGGYPSLSHGIIRRNLQDYSRRESTWKVGEENVHEVV